MRWLQRAALVLLLIGLAAPARAAEAPARAEGKGERWIAALPFGAGQFHNGRIELGIFFATGEALLGTASIAAALATQQLASTHISAHIDVARLNRSIQLAVTMNRIAFAGWAALTAAGIIEAQVNFAPRRATGDGQHGARALMAVTAAPAPGGGLLGVRVAF